jgi:hypothetical protein
MKRDRQQRTLQSRLPARVRRDLTRLFLLARERQTKDGDFPPDPVFVTWPPLSNPCDARDLMTRLQWFLPQDPLVTPVGIPVSRKFSVTAELLSSGTETLDLPPHEKAEIRFLYGHEQWSRALQGNPYLLVWKMLDIRNFSLNSHSGRWFVIDPDWFSLVEAREWSFLYEKANRRSDAASLQEISKRNLQKLRGAAARYRAVNICGSGPSIQQLVDDPPQDALNIICNTAVQSPNLVERLKPAVVAFANGVFFGPSEFARGIISGAERCVRDYNAIIVTGGEYPQYLIATNYPHLREHTLGLKFGTELTIPTENRLEANQSSNVATALMLPLAASLRPPLIEIWGCDGGPSDQRSKWSPWRYFSGGEPMRDSATRVHPAFFRDRIVTERYYEQYYSHHCDYFETLLAFLEGEGLEIRCRTASHIPALQRRFSQTVPEIEQTAQNKPD